MQRVTWASPGRRAVGATAVRRTLAALAHEVSLDDKYNIDFEGRVRDARPLAGSSPAPRRGGTNPC